MTELPSLRESLRDTAERRYGPRRRRLPGRTLRRALVAASWLALLAGMGVVLATRGSDSRSADEVPATPTATFTATPSTTPQTAAPVDPLGPLAAVYAVFRRPSRPEDVPAFPRHNGATLAGTDIHWDDARLLAAVDGRRAYAVPATLHGRPAVCTIVSFAKHGGGMGCGNFSAATAISRPLGSQIYAPPGTAYLELLPDGVASVEVQLSGGGSFTRPVTGNAVFFYSAKRVSAMTWLDSAGRSYSAGDLGLLYEGHG
jgi:hypothetical protein